MFNFGLLASHIPFIAVFAASLLYMLTLSLNKLTGSDEGEDLYPKQTKKVVYQKPANNKASKAYVYSVDDKPAKADEEKIIYQFLACDDKQYYPSGDIPFDRHCFCFSLFSRPPPLV